MARWLYRIFYAKERDCMTNKKKLLGILLTVFMICTSFVLCKDRLQASALPAVSEEPETPKSGQKEPETPKSDQKEPETGQKESETSKSESEEPEAGQEEPANPESEQKNPPVEHGLVRQEDQYKLYLKGKPVTQKGWYKLDGERIYVSKNGVAAARLKESSGSYQYFQYNVKKAAWELQKDTWKTVSRQEYYLNTKGRCTTIYDQDTKKCKVLRGGKMTAAKNEICTLKNGRLYYFNNKGIRTTKKGWHKRSAKSYVQVGKKGYVTARLTSQQNTLHFDLYNYKTSAWNRQKKLWQEVEGKEYYFNGKGSCSKIYVQKTKNLRLAGNGKWTTLKNGTSALKDGKLYYFDRRGKRVGKAGWHKLSADHFLQIGKKGYVTNRLSSQSGTWHYDAYRYSSKKWQRQRNVWKTVDLKKYYFDALGNCTRIYDTMAQKCYDCENGGMALVENDSRKIGSSWYYFGIGGTKGNQAGLYLTVGKRLLYADPFGRVEREIPGIVENYQLWEGKVMSCRVRNGNYITYYNGLGLMTRQIDVNGPMVALTYDDGPSRFTTEILDVLGQYNSAATFFVVGERVNAYANAVKRAYEMGCEIGNHTYSHKSLTGIGAVMIQSQLAMTNTAVAHLTGVSPVVMRPPGGGYNRTVQQAAGMPLILWSIDTLDWKTRNAAATRAEVLSHVKDGDIVLMHDLYGPTAAASRSIVPELIGRGYQLVTVSELAQCRGGMSNGSVYRSFGR